MNNKIDDEELKRGLERIFLAIGGKTDTYAQSAISIANMMRETYKHLDFTEPEHFYLMFRQEAESLMNLVAEQFYNLSENIMEDKYKPTFVFTHYQFLETHIEALGKKREGLCCSTDKSRYILNKYLKYSLTGEVEEFQMEKHNYWEPRFGTAKQWMDFCDSLYQLFHGSVMEFLACYKKLLDAPFRCYQHEEHS